MKENASKILAYFDADKQKDGFRAACVDAGAFCAAPLASAFDRVLATRLGVGAVKALGDGETGVLIGWQKNDGHANAACGHCRTVPSRWIAELLELARILAK